jgi:glycerophosphoryl diester phosphodiesterase
MKQIKKGAGKIVMTGGLLYLGSIAPRLTNRPEPMPKVYYAHRGLHDNETEAPENTLAAFAKAVDQGYGIELDVQLTKDQQVVVAHDFHLKRICGVDREIDSLTYEELQQYPVFGTNQRIPLLTDVLHLVNGQVPLIVEIKYKKVGSKICEKAQAILDDYQGVYCIESFHPQAVLWYRQNRPEICRGQLSSNFQKHDQVHTITHYIMRHLLTNFVTAPDFIAYDCRDYQAVSKNICRKLYHCPSVAWTVRSQEQLEKIRDYYDYFIFEGFIPEGKP